MLSVTDIDESLPIGEERCGREVRLFRSGSGQPTALEARLSELQGREDVRVLEVDPSSSLEDLRLVHLFPALEQLRVYGRKVRTLDGLDGLPRLRGLVVGGGSRGRPIDVRALSGSIVEALELHRCTSEQLVAVSRMPGVKSLSILHGEFAPSSWEGPLESLRMQGRQLIALRDLGRIPTLQDVTLVVCPAFEGFAGDCSNIETLIMSKCPKFRAESLACLRGLRVFAETGVPVDFDALSRLEHLETLHLEQALPEDAVRTNGGFAALTELTMRRSPEVLALAFSERHPRVRLRAGERSYVGGRLVESQGRASAEDPS